MVEIYESADNIPFAELEPLGLKPEFLQALLTSPSHRWVENVNSRMGLARIGKFCFPLTINDTEYENSYVCSPFTALISYPLDELSHIDSFAVRGAIRLLTAVMSPQLRFARINRVLCVNNAMLSTNLYPSWMGESLNLLTRELASRYPRHAIMFRSLNFATTPKLCEAFQASDYQFVPSRLLYVIDPNDRTVLDKKNNQIDFRFLRQSTYSVVPHEGLTDRDDERIKSLYDQLYLKKYSRHNPQFSVELIRLFRRTRQVQFMGLRSKSGELVGIIGTIEMNGQFTTPIVGYDFGLPATDGLYRLLTTLVIQKAFAEKKLFNMSSGVGKFKKHRGAVPFLEYSAIYTRHLPGLPRLMWRTVACLMKRVAAPLVQKYEL
jgi:hypothetical protein